MLSFLQAEAMLVAKTKFILVFTACFLLLLFHTCAYSDDTEGKRRAPIYYNKDGSGETIQFLDGVKITQTPAARFSKNQLDQIVSVLDNTPPQVRSRISNIKAVTNVPWGGEAIINTQSSGGIISLNTDIANRKRDFTELVTHEVGHIALTTLPKSDKSGFIDLHKQSQFPSDFVTPDNPIVKSSYVEDFSDIYMKYNLAPQSIVDHKSPILDQKVEIIDRNFGQGKIE
jgi:hypothetical protein